MAARDNLEIARRTFVLGTAGLAAASLLACKGAHSASSIHIEGARLPESVLALSEVESPPKK